MVIVFIRLMLSLVIWPKAFAVLNVDLINLVFPQFGFPVRVFLGLSCGGLSKSRAKQIAEISSRDNFSDVG